DIEMYSLQSNGFQLTISASKYLFENTIITVDLQDIEVPRTVEGFSKLVKVVKIILSWKARTRRNTETFYEVLKKGHERLKNGCEDVVDIIMFENPERDEFDLVYDESQMELNDDIEEETELLIGKIGKKNTDILSICPIMSFDSEKSSSIACTNKSYRSLSLFCYKDLKFIQEGRVVMNIEDAWKIIDLIIFAKSVTRKWWSCVYSEEALKKIGNQIIDVANSESNADSPKRQRKITTLDEHNILDALVEKPTK
ncbi:10522_t:CDS:2, partial [Entrophospora sp. SA101]